MYESHWAPVKTLPHHPPPNPLHLEFAPRRRLIIHTETSFCFWKSRSPCQVPCQSQGTSFMGVFTDPPKHPFSSLRRNHLDVVRCFFYLFFVSDPLRDLPPRRHIYVLPESPWVDDDGRLPPARADVALLSGQWTSGPGPTGDRRGRRRPRVVESFPQKQP